MLSLVRTGLCLCDWDVAANPISLGMTDPNAQAEDVPPAKPPRPSVAQRQVEADEMYARQLAEHYNRRAPPRRLNEEAARYRQRRDSDPSEDERDYSFFDGMFHRLEHANFGLFCVLSNGCPE